MNHASRLSAKPPFGTPHASLFLFLFAVYLLSYTPRINSSDGQAMFATAESLVRRGALDIEQLRWMDLQQGTFGLDGLLYSRKGIGVPVGLLPLTWLGLVIPWWGMVSTSLLFNPLVTALTAVILSAYLQELGFSQRTGLIVALTFGLSTLAWPYAKSLFSDPFSGLLLLAAAYALLRFSRGAGERGSGGEKDFAPAPSLLRSPALFYPFLAGLCLGWNVATRYAEAVFVPVFGLLLLYYLFKDLRFTIYDLRFTSHASVRSLPLGRFTLHVLPPLLAFSAPILLIGLGLIYFNLSRYGDPFNTGYLPNETFSGILWQGLVGQLLSPGRGLLLYCPIFILSLFGLLPFFRRHRSEAIAGLSVILMHLLLYGQWFMWHGGYAWGPRFMIPTLPFWAIFLAPVAEQAFNKILDFRFSIFDFQSSSLPTSILRVLFLALAGLGLIPQLLSVAIDFAPFQNSLLDAGLPLFDPQTFFDPRYSPLVAAWKFISPDTLDLAWVWQGQVNSWLLGTLIINLLLAAFNLRANQAASQQNMKGSGVKDFFFRAMPGICMLSTLGAVTFLLAHTHSLPPLPLTQAIVALNEGVRPGDAVITNDPEIAMPFAELYKGRAPVLGLQSGGFPLLDPVTRRLNETIAAHPQVWWLPNGLSPEESAIEQTLLAAGFRARNDNFEGQRLVLFAFPAPSATQPVVVEAEFEQPIKLVEAIYPVQNSAGAALPVELHWQALAKISQDYHIFIHLVDEAGKLVAQTDGQPALWQRPTSTWLAGETIVDRHGLWLPPQTAPGDYKLQVGLYRPTDGQRLHLTSGAEFVELPVMIR